LIFTHSLGSDHHMWDQQVQALRDQYYIVSIDNIGHGESDVPSGDYTVADMVAAVMAVADAAELERFHYCGLSVGGFAGQLVGAQHGDRLLSLTLCNTAAKIGAPELWDERIGIATTQGMDALVDGVIARWFAADYAEREPERYGRARSTFLATDPNGYAGVCAALRDGDLRDTVGSITTPTLVIGGIADLAALAARAHLRQPLGRARGGTPQQPRPRTGVHRGTRSVPRRAHAVSNSSQ
jgi:3-oxoadipate enol-lactonase